MDSINLDEIKKDATMGLRSKGSAIFYSCIVLSVSGDKIILSIPTFRDPAVETKRRVELKILNDSGDFGPTLYIGTVNELFANSVEVRVTSKQKYEERRRSIRVPCELRVRYMDPKNADETWYTTYSINMSPGGMKMFSSRFHKEGDSLIFQFYVPEGYSARNLLVRGTVLRIKKVTGINYIHQVSPKGQSYRKYIINVSFEGLSAADYFGMTRYIYTNTRC